MDPNQCVKMICNNSTAGHDESKRSWPISLLLFPRLPHAFLPLREEDTGDRQRASGEFHVLERNQGLFPVHVSLSTLQASGLFGVTMKILSGLMGRENATFLCLRQFPKKRLLQYQSGRVEGPWGRRDVLSIVSAQ